jgi:hypothetical protein
MPSSPTFENYLRLIHDLKDQPENQNTNLEHLMNLLRKADLNTSNLRVLKSETTSLINENVEKSSLLRKFASIKLPDKANEYQVIRREMPVSSLTMLGTETLLGSLASPERTMGPFKTGDGRLYWFDFYKYEKLVKVYVAGDSRPLMLIPVTTSILNARPSMQFNLAKGSVWIRADLFSIKAGAGTYTGLKISGGKLLLNQNQSLTADKMTLPLTTNFSLELQLDNAFAPKGTGAVGMDARIAEVKLPDQIVFNYVNKKFSVTRLGSCSWQLYGDQKRFDWIPNTLNSFSTDLNRILIKLKSDQPGFTVKNCKSDFFKLEGTAFTGSAGWCLAIAELDINKPFAIKNNGGIAIACNEGLQTIWKGAGNGTDFVKLNRPLLMAEPGLIAIREQTADFKLLEENYTLWNRDGDVPLQTKTRLSFLHKKKLEYNSAEEGAENIAALADAQFEIDKPIRADGVVVAPTTKDSIYVKYITETISQMMIWDQDMIAENEAEELKLISKERFVEIKRNPQQYQFAMSNAYLRCTPPAMVMLSGSFDENNRLNTGNLTILYGLFDLIPTLPHPYTSRTLRKQQAIAYRDVSSYNERVKCILASVCKWDHENEARGLVNVDFKLLYNQLAGLPMFGGVADDNSGSPGVLGAYGHLTGPESITYSEKYKDGQERRQDIFALLDLSTNYDLLGISMSFDQRTAFTEKYASVQGSNQTEVVTIERMQLHAPMALLNGFTLPHISWEPMINLSQPLVPSDPPEGLLGFKNNGPATLFTQNDLRPLNINPKAYLNRFKENLKPEEGIVVRAGETPLTEAERAKLQSSVLFGLPNGKISLAYLKPYNPDEAHMNSRHLDLIRPEFALSLNTFKLKGGMQFRIAAEKPANPELPPLLTGLTKQEENLTDPYGNEIHKSVLGKTVHDIFNNVFASEVKDDGVPLTHIDFSGYGASTFSNWLKPLAKYGDVTQVKFDVMTGRVAHEVVQVISVLYPWGITVIRTITLYRRNNAIIFREDSGWIAKSDGLFDFSFRARDKADDKNSVGFFHNPYVFHPGVIEGLFNVHNIREVEGDTLSLPYTPENGDYRVAGNGYVTNTGPANAVAARFIGVTFDADVAIENVTSGLNGKYVTGKQFKGYLQVLPSGVPVPASTFRKLMMSSQNAIGGRVDCAVSLAKSLQLMQLERVEVNASFENNDPARHTFIVAGKGSVQLPADGSWSVVELDKQSGEVSPVANKQSVPLIRIGERARDKARFELYGKSLISQVAFPDALLNDVNAFARRYGYVQNTGTQKLLLGDPRYDLNNPLEMISEAPLLADSFRLLNSKGPFPNMGNALQVENVVDSATKILEKGLSKSITDFPVPDHFEFDVIGKADDAFRMYIQYKSTEKNGPTTGTIVNYVTDSAAGGEKWKNELNNMSIVVDLASFKSLMTISGNFKANAAINPGFDSGTAPQLKLAEPLEKIYQILEFLDNLDPTQPVEAVKKGLQIAMSNAADSWEYKFKASKEIPFVKFPFDPINYNSPTTPLKLDAYFKIGCYFNQPMKIPNTIDQIIPSAGAFLELGADLRVMCVSLAAATVYAVGRAEVGLAADLKNPPTLYFKFGFGIELCVGLPVIGSVSVMYMVGVDMSLNTEVLVVGAFIYFRGRAEIFGGIVTVTIQIEAAGKIEKPLGGGPTSCIATCTFALDISIFWVIDINFSETWEETRQIA